MIFRQLFDAASSTYTYLIADPDEREAVIIDPVNTHLEQYIRLIGELDLKLVFAIDTHIHADHITGVGPLEDRTGCVSVLGEQTAAECVTRRIKEDEIIQVGQQRLRALYTPGHTDDSYSFLMTDRVFTGDTLMIRSTGRTDFQNGSAAQQYDSIFNKLLKLDESILVYPAHDYKGWMVSTIGEEKRYNPRLQVRSESEYVAIMNQLKLDRPQLMDIAVPANLKCGRE
ncbi:MBL fold metallo-hydrolase [bacterium]|nr:MBL fold metallo-hydrolase [bacterium]